MASDEVPPGEEMEIPPGVEDVVVPVSDDPPVQSAPEPASTLDQGADVPGYGADWSATPAPAASSGGAQAPSAGFQDHGEPAPKLFVGQLPRDAPEDEVRECGSTV